VTVAASQNIEISKKGYAAFDEGDVDAVLNDYDDNVEFVVPGNSTVSGTYRGKDGVRELFAKVAEQNFKITPNRFLGDDDVVVVLSQVSMGGESGLQADSSPTATAKSSRPRITGTLPCLNGSTARSSRRGI
jgi:ketosteroid isomerase-like protein